jgi:AcrR family transcriptional regulator
MPATRSARSARESLLDAALAALAEQPWGDIRMVDVAVTAGVSRQTLYNEFGSKEGIAQALARREADDFLAGVERALSATGGSGADAGAGGSGADAGDRFAAATAWMLRTARLNPLVHAALTGCRGERLPAAVITLPVQRRPRARREDQPLTSAEIIAGVRSRAALTLEHALPGYHPADIAWACECAVRLGLSYVTAPAPTDEEACLQVARLVRGLLARGR